MIGTLFGNIALSGSDIPLLTRYPGAAAAYSLRRLSVNTTNVVRVRRSVDNAEDDFTADEITNGTLLGFVNSGEVFTNPDITSATGWTLGANTTYNALTEAFDLVNESALTVRQGKSISGHTYTITIVLDSVTSAGIKVYAGGTQSAVYSTAGTHTFNITAGSSNDILGINPSGITNCSISSFSAIDITANGYVTTWYDQSGNGNDAVQATAASQPKIVSAGSLITSNGYTVIQYDGTDDNLTTSLTATGTMLMGGSDGSAFYEIDINGSYSLLPSASLTDHPLNESIRVIWGSSLTTAQKTAIESLVTYTDWDFSDVTSFYRYWRERSELTDFPLINTSNGTAFGAAWQECTSLTSFPLLNVSSGTNFNQTWYQCSSLTSFPALDLSSGTNFSEAWFACTSLQDFPANMFDSVTGTNFTSAFTSTNLSSQSIENIVVSIDTAGQSNGTLNITGGGNATTATAQTAIDSLTAKGWTVTVPDGYVSPYVIDVYQGSAAAYSLRQLSYNTTDVVRVRRSSDNAEADFTADEVADGTMTAWVNTQVVKYSSDFSSTEDLGEFNGTGAAAQSVGGVDDAYKFTLSGGNVQHTVLTSTSILQSGKSFTIVFDYYIPSGQTISSIVFDNLGGSGAISGSLNVTDNWTTETINFTADGTRPRWWAGALGANVNADGDVFYLKNIVVTQTTADGLVTKWYDQAGSNNATQAIAANQPKIVDAGVLVEENGKPAVQFDGVDDALQTPDYIVELSQNNASVFAVRSVTSIGSGEYLLTEGDVESPYSSNFIVGGSTGNNVLWVNTTVFGTVSVAQQDLLGFTYDGTNFQAYLNGSASGSSGTATVNTEVLNRTVIGAAANFSSGFFTGKTQEIITYKSDQSSNRVGIETNINNHYNIYP